MTLMLNYLVVMGNDQLSHMSIPGKDDGMFCTVLERLNRPPTLSIPFATRNGSS